jgi:hypothetical protein
VDLVSGLAAEPWGQISPSVYETARLVTLAPWLTGHRSRIGFLIAEQRPDGAWGGPAGYALVPTLSATEALLSTARREARPTGVLAAADRALRWLRALPPLALPDTPAVEVIVPALTTLVNAHLDDPPAGLVHWAAAGPLRPPGGCDDQLLAAIRTRLRGGGPVPDKLLHSLEVAGDAAAGAAAVRPQPTGTIGASPAATAAWLRHRSGHRPTGPSTVDRSALGYLNGVVRRHGGPVPSVLPVTVFERTWVLNTLATVGVPAPGADGMLAAIRDGLGPAGTPGGAGLPPDADTTAMALVTLARHGIPVDPGCLLGYETSTHFCTWPGERTPSTSTNAHVLEALGRIAPGVADAAIAKVSGWLCDQQRADGSWTDKWHASPYYATACCAVALDRYGRTGSADPVARAVDWLLETQRPDGSWGRWAGTAEETSYAVQVLLTVRAARTVAAVDEAAARGYRYLLRSIDQQPDPPLWHDKDLYLPVAVVRATVLAAMWSARRHPGVIRRAAAASGSVDAGAGSPPPAR